MMTVRLWIVTAMSEIKHIKRPIVADRGGYGKNSPYWIIPYLPDEECFFDSRHWTYGLLDEALPFAVTTVIDSSCQQYLKVYV